MKINPHQIITLISSRFKILHPKLVIEVVTRFSHCEKRSQGTGVLKIDLFCPFNNGYTGVNIKTFTSVIYKCSYCFRALKQ